MVDVAERGTRQHLVVAVVIFLQTIARRWWALAFLPAFFWAARAERSRARALRFIMIAFAVTLAAEYSSTRWGVPFGRYDYIARGDELSISNVPVFVPLCWGIVVWGARGLAHPLRGWRLALAGGLAAAIIDLVIDPITLRGSEWFQGPLYAYRARGWWFGVPWSNYGGWIVVSAIVIWFDELFEHPRAAGSARARDPGAARARWLAYATCAFFVIVGSAIGEWRIASAGLVVTLGLVAMITVARGRSGNLLSRS
ncbi:MAG: carotenoid biosynthesis protein [Actinobacteria bacterium]|nr:carotenoid biosynthesis protein [Actinomycetota bacterium]